MIALWISTIALAVSLPVFSVVGARRVPFAVWSPVYVIPGVYLTLGLGGYFYYGVTSAYHGGFYDLDVNHEQLARGFAAFLAATVAFLIGAVVQLLYSKRVRHGRARNRSIAMRAGRNARRRLSISGKAALITLIFLSFPLLMIIVGKGPDHILWRTQYLLERYHNINILGSLLALPAMLGLGFITSAKRSWAWRLVCIGLLLAYELVFLALSTRRIVVIFLFYIAGLAVGEARRHTIFLLTAIWVISLPLLLQIPVQLRGMPEQGILALPNNIASIATNAGLGKSYAEAIDSATRNLTFGVPLAGYVGTQPPIPKNILATSLNPLPSFVSVPGLPSWESVAGNLRATLYIPYSALGELLNHGWLWLGGYYFLLGFAAAWLHVGAWHFIGQRSRWGYLVGCGMFLLFAITSTQYNLRSSTRLVWYAVAIAALWRFICRMRIRGNNHRPDLSQSFGQVTSY